MLVVAEAGLGNLAICWRCAHPLIVSADRVVLTPMYWLLKYVSLALAIVWARTRTLPFGDEANKSLSFPVRRPVSRLRMQEKWSHAPSRATEYVKRDERRRSGYVRPHIL